MKEKWHKSGVRIKSRKVQLVLSEKREFAVIMMPFMM